MINKIQLCCLKRKRLFFFFFQNKWTFSLTPSWYTRTLIFSKIRKNPQPRTNFQHHHSSTFSFYIYFNKKKMAPFWTSTHYLFLFVSLRLTSEILICVFKMAHKHANFFCFSNFILSSFSPFFFFFSLSFSFSFHLYIYNFGWKTKFLKKHRRQNKTFWIFECFFSLIFKVHTFFLFHL